MGLLEGAQELDENELRELKREPAPVEIPATRCGCGECKDRVANPVGYWDRVTDKIVKETVS